MRRKAWPLVTLALMFASFAAGRMTLRMHSLPTIAATLPGDVSQFSSELDARIRARFPLGTREEGLIAFLADEGFTPEWRRGADANAGYFLRKGLFCWERVRVIWRADEQGTLTEVGGAFQGECP